MVMATAAALTACTPAYNAGVLPPLAASSADLEPGSAVLLKPASRRAMPDLAGERVDTGRLDLADLRGRVAWSASERPGAPLAAPRHATSLMRRP